ncbi:hypothetical protein GCM10022393_25110 [Aquimarina addita]|uniref:Uncharacterized protein n=1 Tax=Aquimarina addita TaxID=870485 RepID=A0ABP6UKU0_9FLAO
MHLIVKKSIFNKKKCKNYHKCSLILTFNVFLLNDSVLGIYYYNAFYLSKFVFYKIIIFVTLPNDTLYRE